MLDRVDGDKRSLQALASARYLAFADPIVQWPRTPPFHGGNTGSNPVRVASLVEAAAYTINITVSHKVATYIRLCACMFRTIPKIRDRAWRCRLVLGVIAALLSK